MTMRNLAPALLASLTAALAPSAFAQSSDDWTGAYAGVYAGQAQKPDGTGDRFIFDTNLDGRYNDTVTTAAGADAFSPGSCDGVARGPTPASGCIGNSGGADWGIRGGYDWQLGDNWVVGVVGEYGMNDVRDAVSSFSTTPARYTMLRKIDGLAALRGRLGGAFGEGSNNLVYVTAGYATAKIENSFFTSNGVNTFVTNGDGRADGSQFGIGYERRIGQIAVGLEVLRTKLNDDEYRVRAQGPAPATNPFIRQNPAGTDMRRNDDNFNFDSVRLTAVWRF